MAKVQKQSKAILKPDLNHSSIQREYIWSIGLVIFTFLLYANTLGHGFVLDDPLSLALNSNVTAGISGISDIITGSYRENNFGGQLYRPVSLVQFAIEWQWSPNNPAIHHFFNVLWYVLSIVLIFFVGRKWFPDHSILLPFFMALLFASHPLHTEVVANIKSRDEMMSLFFILAAFLSWDKALKQKGMVWLIFSVILYFLGLLSKETAITMFPVFGLLSWYIYGKDFKYALTNGLIFVIPVVILLVIRHALFGDLPPTTISMMDNPVVSAESLSQKFATSMVILMKYFQLLVYPYPLSSDYSYTVIPLADFSSWKVWLSLVLHIGLLVYALLSIKKRSFISLSILGYLMAISLFSQIPMVIGTMFGERLAYLASFWWLIGLIYLIHPYFKSGKDVWSSNKAVILSCSALTWVFVYFTVQRAAVWENNYKLFTTDAATYLQSVRLNNGAAEEMLRSADITNDENEKNKLYEKTEAYCNQIMKIKPVATAYLTLGNIRMKQKRYEEAIDYYDQVNDLQSIVNMNKALAFRELGRIAGEKEQNLSKSQNFLNKSIGLYDKDAETWFLMGVSHGVSGNHLLAAEHFEKAYNLSPTPEYAKNVAMAYDNSGNKAKAEQYKLLLTKK